MDKRVIVKQILLSTGIAFVLGISMLWLIKRSTVSNIIGIGEHFYLQYYYNNVNKDQGGRGRPDSLVIVDISAYRNRKCLSDIIQQVYRCNPSVIGIDVLLDNNPDILGEYDEDLVSSIAYCKDKIVLGCGYYFNKKLELCTKLPFFYADDRVDGIVYGGTLYDNLYPFYSYYNYYDTQLGNRAKNDSLPSFSYAVALKSGRKFHNYPSAFRVNYTHKLFPEHTSIVRDTSDILESVISDRIVLIGDLTDMKDMARMPFKFSLTNQISGIEYHAYCIMSLLESYAGDFLSRNSKYGLSDCPKWVSLLLAIIISLLFSILYHLYFYCQDKTQRLLPLNIILIVLRPLFFLWAESSIVFISFAITYFSNYIPDMFISMTVIAVMGISSEISKKLLRIK